MLRNTVNQELVLNTFNKLWLFVEFKNYLETHENKIDLITFTNNLKIKLQELGTTNSKLLLKYLKTINFELKYKTIFKQLFIDVKTKRIQNRTNIGRVSTYVVEQINYGFELI